MTLARRLAGVLRLRKDLPDARVAEIVRDARVRGAAAGRPLAEELGSPESYAAGFQKDRVAAPRRRAWAVTAFVVIILATRLPGVVAGERPSAWDVAYLLVAVVVLVWHSFVVLGRDEPEQQGRGFLKGTIRGHAFSLPQRS